MPLKKRHEQRMILVAVFAFIALNIPFVLLFNQDKNIAGLPVLWLWIFAVWLFSILVSYFTLNRKSE